jgi:MerR family transcriptional regulator/heat shock protein HspR
MSKKRAGRRGFVMISTVAERYDVHPQTLRMYEREGLLMPPRSEGNTRLFDDPTLRRLEMILALTRDMGVNLAGVEVVLRMREQMEELQLEVDRLSEDVREAVRDRQTTVKRRHALVRIQSGPLSDPRKS